MFQDWPEHTELWRAELRGHSLVFVFDGDKLSCQIVEWPEDRTKWGHFVVPPMSRVH